MKYSQILGVIAALVLVAACFMNWTWYPDIRQYFDGFYSLDNMYGKPGKTLIFLSAIASAFYLIPRVWAKRWNMLVCGLNLAYAIKTFILFSACYRGICPDKQTGLWLMLGSALIMIIAALLPDVKMGKKGEENGQFTAGGGQ